MAKLLKVSIVGGKKIALAFKNSPKESRILFGQALQKSVAKVNEIAKREVPVDSGNLRSHILPAINLGKLRGTVTPGTNYAKFVHDGRKEVFAKRAKVLSFRPQNSRQRGKWAALGRLSKKGFVILGKRVKAQKANPFMERAADRSESFVNRQFTVAAERLIAKITKAG